MHLITGIDEDVVRIEIGMTDARGVESRYRGTHPVPELWTNDIKLPGEWPSTADPHR
jgi:hypothetical protein